MNSLILLACVIGVALCAPKTLYYQLQYKPVQVVPQAAVPAAAAAAALPVAPVAAAAPAELELLLAAQNPALVPGLPARGFIKHEIPHPAGQDSIEVLYPLGFPAAAPVAPAVAVAPVVRAPLPKRDDDDDHDD